MADTLDALVAEIGEEAVAKIAGEWIARSHRDRPRLMWAKPESPARAPHYLAFVRQQACCLCGAPPPSDPHHCGPRGAGQKTDDYRVAPLCRDCHEAVHRAGRMHTPRVKEKIVDTLVRYLRIVEQT